MSIAISRHTAFMLRGGTGKAKCDLCQSAVAVEAHHIISKGMTMGNEEARRLSEVPELLACLCDPCHDTAHSTEGRRKCLRFNADLFGEVEVLTAFMAVAAVMKTPLNIELEENIEQKRDWKGFTWTNADGVELRVGERVPGTEKSWYMDLPDAEPVIYVDEELLLVQEKLQQERK